MDLPSVTVTWVEEEHFVCDLWLSCVAERRRLSLSSSVQHELSKYLLENDCPSQCQAVEVSACPSFEHLTVVRLVLEVQHVIRDVGL